MRKLFISTLGFEEAFLIRFLLRNQPQPRDVMLVVSPFPDDARSIKAYQQVEAFLTKYMPEVEVRRIQVPVDRAHQAIAIIVRTIKSLDVSNAVVNLSGGMRILVIEILAAVKMVFGDDAEIEMELEDKREVVRFRPSIVDLKVPSTKQIRILSAMKELGKNASLTNIKEKTGIPRSSIYKEIKKMEEGGFVTKTDGRHFILTDLGLVWAESEE